MKQNTKRTIEPSVFYLVNKTALFLKMSGLQFFKEKNFAITPEQASILHILYQEDGISQRQLGKTALKDRPNITRLIDILEEKKFVYRELDPQNRRIFKVFITEEGKKQVESILPDIMEARKRAFDGLSEEDLEILKNILVKIQNNLEETFKLQV